MIFPLDRENSNHLNKYIYDQVYQHICALEPDGY